MVFTIEHILEAQCKFYASVQYSRYELLIIMEISCLQLFAAIDTGLFRH